MAVQSIWNIYYLSWRKEAENLLELPGRGLCSLRMRSETFYVEHPIHWMKHNIHLSLVTYCSLLVSWGTYCIEWKMEQHMCWTECAISNWSNGFKIPSARLHKIPLSQIWEISHSSTPYFIQMAIKKLLNTYYVLILFAIHQTNHQ